jgi:hypothetical protein
MKCSVVVVNLDKRRYLVKNIKNDVTVVTFWSQKRVDETHNVEHNELNQLAIRISSLV